MRALLLLAFFLVLFYPGYAQQRVAQARQRSYLTKVFRLTEVQTRRLYEHGMQAARPELFTQVVDSFPTEKPRRRALPLGYYLEAYAEGPRLVYELRAETDRDVLVVDNQVDLTLVVRDSVGQLLPDVQVAVAGQPLAFDAATQSYRRAGGGRAGLVAVTRAGRTTFHPLTQTFPNASPRYRARGHWLKRAGGRVLYGCPLGYLTRPVWRLVRDLKHAGNVSTGPVGLLRSAFNEDVREERQDRRGNSINDGGRWTNYVATS